MRSLARWFVCAACLGAGAAGATGAKTVEPPPGTYRAQNAHPGELLLLVLKDGGRFYAEFNQRTADGQVLTDSGRYRIARGARGAWYIRFSGTSYIGNDLVFKYKALQMALDFHWSNSTRWSRMIRAKTAWCAAAADCRAQGLRSPACEGRWSCRQNACVHRCR
jgi:hypothetical protein